MCINKIIIIIFFNILLMGSLFSEVNNKIKNQVLLPDKSNADNINYYS